jgi:large subunit ribosomal protein L22
MAKTKAIQRNIRISPRKAGLVCDLIRSKPASKAVLILENTDKKAASIILKLLNSAIANASHNHAMSLDSLFVESINANQGPVAKRTMPRARGSADIVKKRTTHLEIVLSDERIVK